MITLRHTFTTFAFAACLFLGMSLTASAKVCTQNSDCTAPQTCAIPFLETQGTCQTPSTNTSDPATPATNPSGTSAGNGTTLTNPLKVDSLEGLLGIILEAAVRIGTIVLILALVYVGFLFVASKGNEEKIRDAKRYFFWIVIGGLLVLGAKGLSAVIQSTATSLGS